MDPNSSGMESQHGHELWFCDGEPFMGEGGSWIGHFALGLVFMIWGLHWVQGIYRNYFTSRRSKAPEYRAQTTYTLWRLSPLSESVCKTFLPIVAMSMELYFAHAGGWRTMICPAGTVRAGHFYANHLNNWQHAAMYPPFILSGLVDLVGHEVELPAGTQQAFLFMAFVCESLLMGLHKKHTPLDIEVHAVLFYTMAATAVFVMLEAIFPRSFLVSCGRAGGALLQAGWFMVAASIMFEGRTMWDEMGGQDMAPSMMVSVWFVGVIILVMACMFVAFLLFHLYYKIMDNKGAVYERAGLLDDDRIEVRPVAAVPLSNLGPSPSNCQA